MYTCIFNKIIYTVSDLQWIRLFIWNTPLLPQFPVISPFYAIILMPTIIQTFTILLLTENFIEFLGLGLYAVMQHLDIYLYFVFTISALDKHTGVMYTCTYNVHNNKTHLSDFQHTSTASQMLSKPLNGPFSVLSPISTKLCSFPSCCNLIILLIYWGISDMKCSMKNPLMLADLLSNWGKQED